jgi:PAS domain S-box-containing protein
VNEISCKITSSFLEYVKHSRPEFLSPLLAGLPYDEGFLSDPNNWVPWDTERILEERLVRLFDDERIMFEIGRSVISLKSLGMVNIVFNMFMTPERLIRYAPKIARFLTKDIVNIDVIDAGASHATVELKIRGRQTRGACLFNQGLFSLTSELFGMGPTSVAEVQCVVPVDQIGKQKGKYYEIDSAGMVVETGGGDGNLATIGRVSESGAFTLNGTVFGAHSCIFRLQWQEPKRRLFSRLPGKEQVMREALVHLEENHAKLENAYERIYKSEEQYRNLLESASDMICFIDTDGIIQLMNRKGLELTGYSHEEIRGRHFLCFIDEAYRKEAEKVFSESLSGSTPLFELEIIKKDSGRVLISTNQTPIKEDGEVKGLMVIARDITAEKEMATRLLEAERFAAKGMVAAEIAHEINNSLANIETALFILDRIKIDRQYRHDVLKDVHEEIDRMSGIVKGILEVYRADTAVIQSVDINAEIMKVISIARRRLNGKGILVTAGLSPGLPSIPCYPGHIKQVLLNLMKNAEESMDLSTSNTIEIATGEMGDYIRIDVVDSGCGVPRDRLPLIGSPLYTSKAEGTGLGLSVSKEIVKKYGGDISIRNEENRGTRVTVLLKKE